MPEPLTTETEVACDHGALFLNEEGTAWECDQCGELFRAIPIKEEPDEEPGLTHEEMYPYGMDQ